MPVKVYTVEQINRYICSTINADPYLMRIGVKGEVSNCKYDSNGKYVFFTLKDENSKMACCMFRSDMERGLGFRLEDGQAVIASGRISVYERDGIYQLYAKRIVLQEDKIGKLNAEFERLKTKLFEEGLFDYEVKKTIPKYPKKIGIVTASTGAVIHDIMSVAKRRDPYIQLILCPVKVQGEGASDMIAQGIKRLDSMNLDTIIVARGGGSIEDLWAFNEEIVARAVFAAKTPVISGVGHEVDTTIVDYVSDLRAATPTAAAELAIPDVMTTINNINNLQSQIKAAFSLKVRNYMLKLSQSSKRLETMNPELKLRSNQQFLIDLNHRMEYAMKTKYDMLKNEYINTDNKLKSLFPDKLLKKRQNEFEIRHRDMIEMSKGKFSSVFDRYQMDIIKLNGLSPSAKLVNGFGGIFEEKENGEIGNPVKNFNQVKKGDKISVVLHNGKIHADVTGTENKIL